MIINLITNSKDIVNYVKEKEGYGGKIEEKEGKYKLINIQIGYLDDFYSKMLSYMENKNISWTETAVRVTDPRGKISGFGNLS